MVELTILDESTVTIGTSAGGVSITGPCSNLYARYCVVDTDVFENGVILVQSGFGHQVLDYTHGSMELLPFIICIIAFQGVKFGLSLARSL